MNIRRAVRLRNALPALLLVVCFPGSACRPRIPEHPLFLHFIDLLTENNVVESPLKQSGADPMQAKYPAGSAVLDDNGCGPDVLGLKRRLTAEGMARTILFAPPRSTYSFRLPAHEAGFLEFGIGIVRDGAPEIPEMGLNDPSGAVSFGVTLEDGNGQKILLEQRIEPPAPGPESAVNASRHKIPLPAAGGRTKLTFQTTGAAGTSAFWSNPVFAVPRESPVNIILVSIDTLRPDHLGLYGYERPVSPVLDSLAAEAAVFENVYTTAPWTLPAHVSLFTGQDCVRHRVYDELARVNSATETLAEKLRAAGYATEAITGGGFVSAEYGLGKGFDEYHMEYGDNVHPTQVAKAGADTVRWLEGNADRPFFLFLHTYQVHLPYDTPESYRTPFLPPGAKWTSFALEENLGGIAGVFRPFDEAERANIIALYDSGIRYTDEALIKPVLESLRRLGIYDRTLIIVTSDHGEEFYEHGGWDHTHNVYEELIRIPLVVKMPDGAYRGRRYSPIVRITDIMPTILQVAGVGYNEDSLDGAALCPILEGKETAARPFLAELSDDVYGCHIPPRLALSDGSLKVIFNIPFSRERLDFFLAEPPPFPALEIYDLGLDPKEKDNLARLPGEAARRRVLVQKAQEIRQLLPPRGTSRLKISKELEERLKALGYLK